VFERFTERAREVVVLAQEEARCLLHNYIGTEHLLLGLITEGEGIAARILLDLGYDAEKLRNEVAQALSGGPSVYPPERLYGRPGTQPMALLARAAPEIRDRFNRTVDRGDLLLVLASAPSGVVARAFSELGIDLHAVRAALDRAREQAPDDLDEQLRAARERKDAAVEAGEIEAARDALADEARLTVERDADAMEAARKYLGL
jgi:ATP-dependent Clp protease ATP-binding subunit ClpA